MTNIHPLTHTTPSVKKFSFQTVARELQNYLEALLRLIYTADCELCQKILEIQETHLCSNCLESIERLRLAPEETPLAKAPPFVDQAWGLFPYEGPVRKILSTVKFMRKRWLLSIFQKSLRDFFAAQASENSYDAMIPVPISKRKLIEREFNQTEILANLIRKTTRVPVKTKLLKKRFDVPPQSGLNRAERAFNLHGIFQVSRPSKIQGKTFLLIDDIMTTGKTAEEAAKTLKQGGARRVDCFALARTERSL